MEAGRNLFSSSPPIPPRTHLKNCSSSSSSVLMLHEQSARALPSMPTTSSAQHFPTSVLQEQRDDTRLLLHITKEEKKSQVTLDRRPMESWSSAHEDNNNDADQCLKDFRHQMLNLPGLWYLLLSLKKESITSLATLSVLGDTKKPKDVEPHNVVSLAKKALSASKQAVSLAENSQLYAAEVDESVTPSPTPTSFSDFPLEEAKTVRSTRLLERRSKRRSVPKPNVMVHEISNSGREGLQRKTSKDFDPNDPLRMFLRGTETRQLLTVKEETELIAHIQDLMRLEEVKSRLQSQLDREPTIVEWAGTVGLSCRDLKLQLHRGHGSRKKLIYANCRMVVHIAKQYLGRGLSLPDLLQEGSKGLIRSVERFKPQGGCRFASYSYWWIRKAIQSAIFQHSRTIRLPDNVYGLLKKVTEAKRLCIREGNYQPTNENIADHVGITVEKLELLLFSTRMPLSLQQTVWRDQNTTYQEITADPTTQTPEVTVAKQFMRQHVRNLLSVLTPREREIIRLRFGIEGSRPKTLLEIGAVYGLSKERVRQLESRALDKLKQSIDCQGLGAYADLLI
ncbi:RNA polymerase sigma factor sigF, chloroplastic-like isoform X1 [Actinidia eriantha]|uniref:RNA polymerase sigma factor sigF, chloroplastic-like isoform X1 n=1 Tax=Actinidia eriantha TaxID=165200 RepID=UPI00258978F3|nr:RNA polymerase sigma factor sigF, chloroplastic-like isoform X1 [Actinidia eriantha]